MISTKVKVLGVLLLVLVSIHQSEEKNFLKKIGRGLKKVGKEVGRGVKKVGKEVGRGVKRVGKEVWRGRKLVKNLVMKPLHGWTKLSFPIVKLLGLRKKGKVEVESSQPTGEVNAPANEAFDAKLLRLHNQLRTEAKSEPAMKWDKLLATSAQEWANACSISYKIFGDSRDDTYGQNIYPVKEADADAYNAVQMWHSFSDTYKADKFECKDNQDCYPYLQMIWPATKYIGCAVSKCGNIKDLGAAGSVLACFYTPI